MSRSRYPVKVNVNVTGPTGRALLARAGASAAIVTSISGALRAANPLSQPDLISPRQSTAAVNAVNNVAGVVVAMAAQSFTIVHAAHSSL
jgi:hypothetical protein